MTTLEQLRAEFISHYPKNYAGEPELGGKSCVYSLNDILLIIDKYAEQEKLMIIEANVNGYTEGLKDSSKAEPCDDAISRNDMLDAVGHGTTYTSLEVQKIINVLPSVNPVPCDDVVSRQAVLEKITNAICFYPEQGEKKLERLRLEINELPSVRPQEQTGHWDCKEIPNTTITGYWCSKCHIGSSEPYDYCPNCGAKMVEPQESDGAI